MRKKICQMKGCEKKSVARGYCSTHYDQLRKKGKLKLVRNCYKEHSVCIVEGCNEPPISLKMCHHHYKRYYDTGSYEEKDLQRPVKVKGVKGTTIKERLENFSKEVKKGKKIKGSYCIEWTGSFSNDGYGQTEYKGKNWRIHRLAYIEAYGEIPEDKPLICHHCDNPRCINPDHLYAGTQKDNAHDRMERGRSNIKIGEKAASAKLTEQQAIEIIQRRKSGEKEENIAKDYGISYWTVGDVYRGKKCWGHIDRNSIKSYKEARKDFAGKICNVKTKLTEDQVKEIKRLILFDSYSQSVLAKQFNVSRKLISNIREGKTWTHIPWPTTIKRRRKKLKYP